MYTEKPILLRKQKTHADKHGMFSQ